MPAQKPIAEQISAARAKKEKAEAKLKQLEAKAKEDAKKYDLRRRIVVGGAILATLETDPHLAASLRAILAKQVTLPLDREVVADLLPAGAAAESEKSG